MISNIYESLLLELSEPLKCEQLVPDPNNTCLIALKEGIDVQIEPDPEGERLIIGCNIGVIPPGGYRASVFIEALKFNGLPSPQLGAFAFNSDNDQLVFFTKLRMQNLTGQQVYEYLTKFTAKALTWKKEIDAGRVPQVETESSKFITGRRAGPFGMTP